MSPQRHLVEKDRLELLLEINMHIISRKLKFITNNILLIKNVHLSVR